MAVGRAQRFEQRKERVSAVFGQDARVLRSVFDVLTLLEMAWHDCYGEVTPPEEVIDEILLCSGGTLAGLVDAAHLAVVDPRDLSLRAASTRAGGLDPRARRAR